MEMAYRDRWAPEIAALQAILAGFPLAEACKWGKPTYMAGGQNVVIIQGFKDYIALGFFQGALMSDPDRLLVQLGQVQAARVMKFTSNAEIAAKSRAIKAYLTEAIALADAGRKVEKTPAAVPVPEELTARLAADPALRRAFEALTPGRQRSWLYHISGAKQSATRTSRIDKAVPAILAGRGFLERP